MAKYVDKAELAAELRRYHATGTASEALISMIDATIRGAVSSICPPRHSTYDDHCQTAWVLVLRKLPTLGAEGNPFGYLATIAINSARLGYYSKREMTFTAAFAEGFMSEDIARKPSYAPKKD